MVRSSGAEGSLVAFDSWLLAEGTGDPRARLNPNAGAAGAVEGLSSSLAF